MPRGKYIRTPAIKEKYSKKKTGNQNPNFKHGSYTKQTLQNQHDKKMAELKDQEIIKNQTYNNKQWLFKKYCIEETSIVKIAEICKTDYETIWFKLRDFSIPRINMVRSKAWHEWVEKQKKFETL